MKQLLIVLLIFMTAMANEKCDKQYELPDSLQPDYTVGYAAFGGSYYDLDNLNSSLSQSGAPTLDRGVFNFTFGEESHYKQFIAGGTFTGHIWRIAENSERRTFLGSADIGAIFGYDFLNEERISLFPYLGFGAGVIFLQQAYQDEPFDSVSKGNSPADESLWQFTLDIKTAVGFDFHLKDEDISPLIGIRAGYRFDVSSGTRWYRDFSTVSAAPSLNLSGPFVTVVFGLVQKQKKDGVKAE